MSVCVGLYPLSESVPPEPDPTEVPPQVLEELIQRVDINQHKQTFLVLYISVYNVVKMVYIHSLNQLLQNQTQQRYQHIPPPVL
jgi:hypothetical protein